MGAIKDIAQKYHYQSPGKDRRLARKISAELYRFEQIEKAARLLLDNKKVITTVLPETAPLFDAIKKAVLLSTEIDND